MNEPMIIEEINNHIDNSTTEIISNINNTSIPQELITNINNANTYAYNSNYSAYYANQRAYYANQHAYNSNSNASKCNAILSNIYYSNGDIKKHRRLYLTRFQFTAVDRNPITILSDDDWILYGLTFSGTRNNALWIDGQLVANAPNSSTYLNGVCLRRGSTFVGGGNEQNISNYVSQGYTANWDFKITNLAVNTSCTSATNNVDVTVLYSSYE